MRRNTWPLPRLILSTALMAALVGATVSALSVSTHRHVNRQAAATSPAIDTYLRARLGFAAGFGTNLRHGRDVLSVRDWLSEGGAREDDLFRVLRHFHDPLKPWDTAGLDLGVIRYDSSVRWMQDPPQGVPLTVSFWSWRDARRLYYEALTEPDPLQREALWADLFRALGQIMHLVVDASVPEHTRNDMHPLGALTLGNSYERWVASQHGVGNAQSEAQFIARYLSAPIGFVSDIFELPPPAGESVAKVPVARLIDADRYDGGNPGGTVVGADPRAPVSAGLAEIANANFFSEDTLRGQYPFPTDEGLIPVNLATPFGRVRRYLTRPSGQGLLPANPLRAECAADAYFQRGQLAQPPPYPCMDGVVWNQIAAHMLPRAVGYARGVLDYFFRDSVRVARVLLNADGIWIDIENRSDELMEGVFEVHARRYKGSALERRELVATLNGGATMSIEAGTSVTLPLDLLPGDPAAYFVLVFRGRLGGEADAVAGHVFAVPAVEIVQRTYQADVTKTCKTSRARPTSQVPLSETLVCTWQPINHRVEGTLVTNLNGSDAANPSDPVIESIEAFWTGGALAPAPLTINGVEYADGLWVRQGHEPDPESFVVMDPAARGARELWLEVYVRGWDEEFDTQLATFSEVTSIAEKSIRTIPSSLPSMAYLRSSRVTRVEPHRYGPLFALTSIGGYAVPTKTQRDQLSSSLDLWREALDVSTVGAEQRFVDLFQTFPRDQIAAFEPAWEAIELESLFPEAPDLHWSAVVVPRPLLPLVLAYRHAFVAPGDSPSYAITLTGREAGAP